MQQLSPKAGPGLQSNVPIAGLTVGTHVFLGLTTGRDGAYDVYDQRLLGGSGG